MAKSKKDDRPAPSWEIVRAVKIEGGFATCVCGNKIKLEPEGPILKYGKREFLPHGITLGFPFLATYSERQRCQSV
jgi:hypothetical protein